MLFFSFASITLDAGDGLFYQPKHWPKPNYYFKGNPIEIDKFNLGRALFYDPILSADSSVSCATCHLQYTAFAHVDHALSHGIQGRVGKRNAPVLINLAWMPYFHWDGGVGGLNGQPVNPIENQDEMGSKLEDVLIKLNKNPSYAKAFKKVFQTDEIRTYHLMMAIGQFTSSLVSANSKYDQVQNKTAGIYFSDQESKGYILFKKYCSSCHLEPLFTNHAFKSNGISVDDQNPDLGRMIITGRKKDSILFKVPTLRNIEYSFPYMHDGRYRKLKEVLAHYAQLHSSSNYYSKELKIKDFTLSDNDQKDLLAFLKTLTDKEFLFNKSYSYYKIEQVNGN